MFSRLSLPVILSAGYLIFGISWILFTGILAVQLSQDKILALEEIEKYKGLLFIILSAVFVYVFSMRLFRKNRFLLDEYKGVFRIKQGMGIASNEGIYELDLKTGRIRYSNNFKQLFGDFKGMRTTEGMDWEEKIHEEDRERVIKGFQEALGGGLEYWRDEYRFLTPKGYKEVNHSIYILRKADGSAYYITGAVQDITEVRLLQRLYFEKQLDLKNERTKIIIRAAEKERNRWAQELHDNIGQMINAGKMSLEMSSNLQKDEMLQRCKTILEDSIREIRYLSANLRPPEFSEESLKHAILSLAENIRQVREMEISIDADDKLCDEKLNEEQKLMVYRIIQEQMNNIIKYAAADKVTIKIWPDDKKAALKITDNGKGFNPAETGGGIGLKNMRSRLKLFNGKMRITSAPGKGCELRAEFRV